MREEHKRERMLLWFEAQLPEHDWRDPHITLKPDVADIVINEGDHPRITYYQGTVLSGWGMVTVETSCRRCGQSAKWAPHNRVNGEHFTEDYNKVVAEMMDRLRAEYSEKCWGDVPEMPRQDDVCVVMDGSS